MGASLSAAERMVLSNLVRETLLRLHEDAIARVDDSQDVTIIGEGQIHLFHGLSHLPASAFGLTIIRNGRCVRGNGPDFEAAFQAARELDARDTPKRPCPDCPLTGPVTCEPGNDCPAEDEVERARRGA